MIILDTYTVLQKYIIHIYDDSNNRQKYVYDGNTINDLQQQDYPSE